MLIDEVETIWSAIDERDDWAPLHDKIKAIRRMGVTAAFLTPGRLATLNPESLPGLVSLACGGESFPGELAARWAPGRRLLNCYGPTETTVYTSVFQCAVGMAGDPSIGRPISGAQIYLLDRSGSGEIVPAGSPVVTVG